MNFSMRLCFLLKISKLTLINRRTFSAIAEPRLYILAPFYTQFLQFCDSLFTRNSGVSVCEKYCQTGHKNRQSIDRSIKNYRKQWPLPQHTIIRGKYDNGNLSIRVIWNINSQGSSFNIVIYTHVLKPEWKMQI